MTNDDDLQRSNTRIYATVVECHGDNCGIVRSWPSLCENSWLENKTCMRSLWLAVCAYRVLKEATLMRVFQVLREGKIVFTHPRPIAASCTAQCDVSVVP